MNDLLLMQHQGTADALFGMATEMLMAMVWLAWLSALRSAKTIESTAWYTNTITGKSPLA